MNIINKAVGSLNLENFQLSVKIDENSNKTIVCECGKDKFLKVKNNFLCLSCNNRYKIN